MTVIMTTKLTSLGLDDDDDNDDAVELIDCRNPLHFLNTILVSSHMYPENPEGTRVTVGSINRLIYYMIT